MYMHHMEPTSHVKAAVPAQAIIEVCLCHHARRTARAVSRLFDEALAPTGLKSGQFNILCAVAARDVTTAGEVATLLAMDRTTLSRNLKPLRAAGYVNREGGAGRRPDALALTHAGRVVLDQGVILWRAAQSCLTVRLGAGQSSLLLHSLETAAKAAVM